VVLFWHLGMLKLLPFLRIGTSSKVAVYLHGTEAWAPFDRSVNRLMNRVDLFLANSDFTWLRFGDQHPELVNKPWRRVALGLGEPAPAADASSRPVAIMIGRMARTEGYKGHGEVLEAWPMVERALPGAELCIVGTGDLEADLRGRAKRLALNSVRFTGSVTEQQKHELLCQSRCLLMPSSGEGFGLVYLEAMRLGRPCLVSHLDAGQEVVNPPEAGLAADRSNMPELSSAVVRLLADTPEQRSMSVNAKRRYEAHFTARHFSSRLLRALEEMVHPGGRVEALREELV
jgi:phosphatidylinositol alpha-1,6-mannosyltransferase